MQAAGHVAMEHALRALRLQGDIRFEHTEYAGRDFGGVHQSEPLAVVQPASSEDVANVVRLVAHSSTRLTLAARGNGHSIHGQAQADVVVDMRTLKGIHVSADGAYVEACGGELWIDVLQACLREGLAPRSWPDYLYLTVGGTIQTAGVGGQTFRFGPVISNVTQLEVVTGRGELLTCSADANADLFHAVLGGLGQFGIVCKARILVHRAPSKVKWIRAVYADFELFTRDQERLISSDEPAFDYLEGFIFCNNDDPLSGHAQVSFDVDAQPPLDVSLHVPPAAGPVLYCLEVAKHVFLQQDHVALDQELEAVLEQLQCIKQLCFVREVQYQEFLNRVHAEESALRRAGMWEQAPHPWLNILVAGSCMGRLSSALFTPSNSVNLIHGVGGRMLLYPMRKPKWNAHASIVTPDEDIFYLLALLRFNLAPPEGPSAESLVTENVRIMERLERSGILFTAYMPHITSQESCHRHFGSKWERFVVLKQTFDPLGILSPGQRIFSRVPSTLSSTQDVDNPM